MAKTEIMYNIGAHNPDNNLSAEGAAGIVLQQLNGKLYEGNIQREMIEKYQRWFPAAWGVFDQEDRLWMIWEVDESGFTIETPPIEDKDKLTIKSLLRKLRRAGMQKKPVIFCGIGLAK